MQRRQKHARHGGRVMLASLHVRRVRRGEVGYGLWGTGQRRVSLSANRCLCCGLAIGQRHCRRGDGYQVKA